MKLTKDINIPVVHADSKKDYVFDLHIAQKHNAKVINKFQSELTSYIKQTQRNSFIVKPSDSNGIVLHDSDLISVDKSGSRYTITTDYEKEFEGVLVYNASGILSNDEIKMSFVLNTDLTEDKTQIRIDFINTISQEFRIVLL